MQTKPHYTKTKGAFITFLVVLFILLLCISEPSKASEKPPKETNHFHRCQSIKNGVRCNKEALDGEKYCFEDIQNESI